MLKNKSVWFVAAMLAVMLYLVFTLLFTWLFRQTTTLQLPNTPLPAPTFTPVPTWTPVVIAQVTPHTATPPPTLATATPLPPTATPPPTVTPTPAVPQVIAASSVNLRAGPGTDYAVVGLLPPAAPLAVRGRNEAGTWWQVSLADGSLAWVADSVVEAQNTTGVPIAQAPPPPPPTPTPVPTEPPRPSFQYEPTGWYGDTNYGLTRFLGTITDLNGTPVNGVSVEAQCGGFRIISNPSGPVGWPPFYDSAGDPPGFYDITLDRRAIPCKWFLTVVETPDGKTVTARLSDAIEVETTVEQSIVTANWRKNW